MVRSIAGVTTAIASVFFHMERKFLSFAERRDTNHTRVMLSVSAADE